jgi:hypothetical protein
MNRFLSAAVIALFAGMMCFGQTAASAPPSAQAATPNAVGHGAFPVKVTKTLESGKLKEGDAVEAETVGSFKLPDGTLVPKGSKLVGHVVASKARSKGDADSELTLTFDKLAVANGKQLSVKGVVQAVFPPAEEAHDPQMAGAASVAGGGGMGAPGTVTNARSGDNTASGNTPQPAADPKSVGVHGIHDLDLGQSGVLTSKGKQVKLSSGVRMIVRVDILG